MYEQTKLKEARYFYARMRECEADGDAFIHNLSAFLSAARSVLQYASKETKQKTGGTSWYDRQMQAHEITRFFKDTRDVNVHTQPVVPVQNIGLSITETVRLSFSVAIQVLDALGNVVSESKSEEVQPSSLFASDPPPVTYKYRFTDWSGSEDVMVLSQLYLDELTAIASDGFTQGFLTP